MNRQETPSDQDYLLEIYKQKGFCYVSYLFQYVQGLNEKKIQDKACATIENLTNQMEKYLFDYFDQQVQQPFANFVVQKVLKSCSQISLVEEELIGIYNCLRVYKDKSAQVDVYNKFLNEIWISNHISFYIQANMAIDQVVHGDAVIGVRSNNCYLVKVERVVDIIQNVFKMSSAMSLLEATNMSEVPFVILQAVLSSLLMNVNIEYQQGQAHINSKDLQLQLVFEFEKLRQKFQQPKKKPEIIDKKGNKLNITDASIMNKTFLGVDTILYPAVEKTKPQTHGKLARRQTIRNDNVESQITGLKGYPASGKQVYNLMVEEKHKQIKKSIQEVVFDRSKSRDKKIEVELSMKVSNLINSKGSGTKIFNNNPPKRELYQPSQNISKQEQNIQLIINQTAKSKNLFQLEESPEKTQNQSFNNYQIKKMYNPQDVGSFGAAETKLKQMQIQKEELEKIQIELQKQNQNLKNELKQNQNTIPAPKQKRIEELLFDLANLILDNERENLKLIHKHGESELKVIEHRENVLNNLEQIFSEIGKQKSYEFVQQEFKKGKKSRITTAEEDQLFNKQESDTEDQSDDFEAIKEIDPKESISGLITGFSKNRKITKQVSLEEVPLPQGLKIDASYLEKYKNSKSFKQYIAVKDYCGTDDRYLSLLKGESVTGFSQEGSWICGFKDTNRGLFGFAPQSYLLFQRDTRSGTPTSPIFRD